MDATARAAPFSVKLRDKIKNSHRQARRLTLLPVAQQKGRWRACLAGGVIPLATLIQTVWQDLCTRLSISNSADLWAKITTAYGEPHRHYHTLDHIAAVVTLFETVRDRFEDPDQALLALYFHDIIYDPSRHDNEAQSAHVLMNRLPGHDVSRAAHHILATQKHLAEHDPDTNLVLDIDMSILGAPWPDYFAYARGVACEYMPVYGNDAYAAGRVALFLTPTIERDRIFLTEPFNYLDVQTKQNLSAERDLWQNGDFGPI